MAHLSTCPHLLAHLLEVMPHESENVRVVDEVSLKSMRDDFQILSLSENQLLIPIPTTE